MLWNDLRYALRLMRRSPGFTIVAVLSLALGIGANTAVFSLLHTVMLRPLAVDRPEELVALLQQYPGEPRGGYWSWRSVDHIRNHTRVYSDVTSTSFDNLMRVRVEGAEPETVVGENVRGNYFTFLGLKPALGRLITPEDAPAAGKGAVVVLSWSYWNSRFHRDPSVLGKRIYMDNTPSTIIGVAPHSYAGPRVGARTDLWLPVGQSGGGVLARLKPGATIQQARAELPVLNRFAIEERAANSKDPLVWQVTAEAEPAASGFSRVRDQYGKPLVLLMSVVGLLLLLACINMAGMLLARGAARRREMAVRMGLGASAGRLIRQVLTESLLLSGAGTVAGVLLAWAGVSVLVRIMASARLHERILLEVEPDLPILLFTAAMAVITGLLFGLAPALQAFRSAPSVGLRTFGSAGEPRSWRLFARGLVSVQVGLSILLVTGAIVFLAHLTRLRTQDLGFISENVLQLQLDPERSGYTREQLAQPYQQLLERLRSIPGVQSASITGCTPIQGCGASRFVNAPGFIERPEERRFISLSWVAPSYFETLGIPLLAGRDFNFTDAGRSRVAIISESMAKHYFPNLSPIGRQLHIDPDPRTGGWYGTDEPYEVIGVVGDIKYTELRDPPRRSMYFNMFQESRLSHRFVIKTRVDAASLTGDARRAVQDVLKTVPVTRVSTLASQIDAALVPERLIATLSGYFGALGAILASVGLYGLLAYTVSRRISEIGIRMALGATRASITRLVLRDALSMLVAGLGIGLPLVIWSRPFAARLVADLSIPSAAPFYWGAAAILVIVLPAATIPARRAARIDPVEALRQE